MKLPIRLENAITKLYTAFHEGTLNGLICTQCVIGNLCKNNSSWHDVLNSGRVNIENYTGKLKLLIDQTGYTPYQLAEIEQVFLKYSQGTGVTEGNYKGLCAVVEYLCELDNIPNVMDYTKLFETENDKPKYQLNTI